MQCANVRGGTGQGDVDRLGLEALGELGTAHLFLPPVEGPLQRGFQCVDGLTEGRALLRRQRAEAAGERGHLTLAAQVLRVPRRQRLTVACSSQILLRSLTNLLQLVVHRSTSPRGCLRQEKNPVAQGRGVSTRYHPVSPAAPAISVARRPRRQHLLR